jgi:hypothetical protein
MTYSEKTDKRKWETHMVGIGICRETQKNVENEKNTLQDLKYCEKESKMSKMKNVHSRTWNKVRNLKNVENETQKL